MAPGVYMADADDLSGQRGGKGISHRVGGGVGQRGVDEAVGRATLAALSGGLLFLSDQPAALPSSSLAVVSGKLQPSGPPVLIDVAVCNCRRQLALPARCLRSSRLVCRVPSRTSAS